MQEQNEKNRLIRAAIGRGAEGTINSHIRHDYISWLDGKPAAPRLYLEMMETLRIGLNRSLFLGLFEFEAHYALYQQGGFYKKHIDSLTGTRNRIISSVSYLTPHWREEDGGHLVLYDPAAPDREITRILPCAGTLVLFMSEEIPHEVLPPQRARASIAGWYRCNISGENRIDPAF